ncbi:hypothetical protein AAH582_10645 [Sphingobacterium multivorum]
MGQYKIDVGIAGFYGNGSGDAQQAALDQKSIPRLCTYFLEYFGQGAVLLGETDVLSYCSEADL